MSPNLFFEPLARPLLVVHALVAMALLGAVTHQAILSVAFLLGRFGRSGLEAVYVRLISWLYPAVFALGAIIYPVYRIRVRAEVLDLTAPWASSAFDIKENLAVLGLLLALTLAATRPALRPARGDVGTRLHALGGLTLAALTWAMVVLGLIVTAEEGL